MKYRKKVAAFVAAAMVTSFLPQGIFANSQRPIQEIQSITVGHSLTKLSDGTTSIMPNVQVDWLPPKENPGPAVSGDDDTKNEELYDVIVSNVNNTSNVKKAEDISKDKFTANAGAYSIKIEEYFKSFMQNGALYKIDINAKHKHKITNSKNEIEWVDAPSTGEKKPVGYFITDFNIKAEAQDSLLFSWEYIPGVSYRLFYDKGNLNDISKMSGTGIDVSAQQAKAHLNEDGTRVEWQVEGAVAGQIYSAYVLPTGIENAAVDFADIDYNKDTPKIIHITPNILLEIQKLGENKLRLSWNINDSAWVSVDNALYQTVIYKINEKGEEEELGRIHNDNNGNVDVGYFECAMPSDPVTYRVDFILKNKATNAIEKGFSAGPKKYVPDEVKKVPFQPIIPQLFPYKSGDIPASEDITMQSKYKVKFNGDYDDLILSNTNISEFQGSTFHYSVDSNKASVQLVWDAPQVGNTGEVDYDLYYDIWVSESAASFKDTDKVVSNLKIEKGSTKNIIYKLDGLTVVGMKTTLEDLKTNKTYYIKMVAKRKYADGDESISIPAIKEVSIPSTSDEYEPPVVGKPPLQIDSVTKDSISVKWANKWYEIMAKQSMLALYTDPIEKILAQWGHSRVYLTGNQDVPIAFRDPDQKYGIPTDLYGSNVEQKLKPYNSIISEGNYVLKHVELGQDVRYKVKVIKQTEVDDARGSKSLEEWVMGIDTQEIDTLWTDVTDRLTSTTVDGVSGSFLQVTQDYNNAPLEANTPYIILISVCRQIDGTWRYSTIPSYILETTATDHESELVTPKTPRLYNYKDKDVRDTEVTVRWVYNANFDYELVYSRLDDPDSAEVWSFTDDDKKTFVDGGEAYVTISGLLPETTYNFWIRAKQKTELVTEGEPKISDWSTPVTSTTLSIGTPLPPSGLGLASYKSIQEAGKDFKPSGEDYLTVEWMRTASDINNKNENLTYSYVVEFADNPEFSDATIATVTDSAAAMADEQDKNDKVTVEFISKNIIRFNGLRANMPYYIKVKTVLTYKNGDKEIVKESVYTSRVRLITSKSSGEYDGGDNENIVTYDQPVKQTFSNGIWTYEMQDVAKITSDMLNKGDCYYTITMENYHNKYDANTRSIKMPKIILDTLINKGMALKIVTNRGIYDIPGEALKNYASKYDAKDSVQIDLTRMDASDIAMYNRSYPETYHNGEKMDVRIKGNAINKFDNAVKVSLKLDVVSSYNYSTYTTYQYNYSAGSWTNYKYNVDSNNNSYLTFSTVNTGLNAIYEKTVQNGSVNAGYTMNQIASKYNVNGLGTVFFKNDYVSASQYVKLLIGIRSGADSVDLTSSASAADYMKAKAAGIYIGSGRGSLTKEQALAGVVKLYEINNGLQIKPSNVSFKGTTSTYSKAVSKAYAIGLITDINPQQKITYEELCDWLVQVVE